MKRFNTYSKYGVQYIENLNKATVTISIADFRTIENKLKRLTEYEDTGLSVETAKEIYEKMDYLLGHFTKNIENETLGWFERAVWHCKKAGALEREKERLLEELEFWKRESISDKSKLGLLRIWLTENELDMDDIIKKISEQVK